MFYWRWFNRPRHPLVRALLAVLGLVLLAGILVFGFFALIAFAFIGTIVAIMRAFMRSYHGAPQAVPADPRVIEGEYVVLQSDTATLKR